MRVNHASKVPVLEIADHCGLLDRCAVQTTFEALNPTGVLVSAGHVFPLA